MHIRTRFTSAEIDRRRLRVIVRAITAACCVLAGLITAGPTVANERQSLDEIRDAVRAHTEANLPAEGNGSVEVGRIDSRLRLARCEEPLETFDPPGRSGSQRSTVGVRCDFPSPWTLYVSVRVEMLKEVYAAARTIPRGSRIGEEDIMRVEMDVNRMTRGYFTSAEQLLGMESQRALREGDIITASRVGAPQLVERGQTVLITAENGSTRISMNGEALQSGALGERIRVRNSSSERVVEGEIVADSRVRVSF
ncbi:flagellar basal body P-ring formation protein FlgA [Aquisalimonas sp. 2447]|uniref:flagellar basal body P-ring formation chaperone FlgA n=1 Tax=Aquisalimonas sp. 2447 TaxID=2740807 RepID=UPI0014327A28|nr:flagellar basal body P-ring formation chaperone FlgA [Aquisalimonas sp. 2447]QIT56179.1 flagellar basal body P-ring formation protein FlgA [Aquisalimonas sp. 2447]